MGRFQAIDHPDLLEADDEARLAWLRRQVGDLGAGPEGGGPVLALGLDAVDRHLPWGGLPLAGLHEVAGGAGTSFALGVLAALLANPDERRPVLWCQAWAAAQERGALYGPGLVDLGVDPDRLLLVTARREREALWAMEEALTSGAVAAAVGEAVSLGMTESRRLQLAAGRGGAMGLLLRGAAGDRGPSAALSRWRMEAVPAEAGGAAGAAGLPLPGAARFELSLWRCRGGTPQSWMVTHDEQTLRFALAAPLADRPAAAACAG